MLIYITNGLAIKMEDIRS